jgi:hypothetical protein
MRSTGEVKKSKYPESDDKMGTVGKRRRNWVSNAQKLE